MRADPTNLGTLTVRVGVPKPWPKWYVEKVEKPDQMYFALKNYKQMEYMACLANGDGMVNDPKIEKDSTWEIVSVGIDRMVWYNPAHKRYLRWGGGTSDGSVVHCDAKTKEEATVWTSPYINGQKIIGE